MRISVALCTYNGSKYLTKQIDSILNQESFKLDEIVICDDNSTDDTLEILNNYQKIYPVIFKVYQNEIKLGSTKNFEKAIKLCTGDFIFLSDQDDIWKSNKIKQILAVFEKNPNAEGVFSNADLIDEKDAPIGSLTLWESVSFLEKELPKPIAFFDILLNGNVVTGATLCIKSDIKKFIFPFTDEVLHDEKIANLLALRKSLFYSTENLISYRLHSEQQVGIKSIHKIVAKNKLKRIILGLEKPSTFNEYRYLSKKIYLKIQNAKRYQNLFSSKIDVHNLITKKYKEFHELNTIMKLKFPLRYRFITLSDKLRGKRRV